jgi:nicotinamidase-related amidase
MSIPGIESSQLGVLLIDAQPVFFQYAFPEDDGGGEPVMVRLEHLLMLADWLDLPVVATFEDPIAENGELPDRLEAVFPAAGQRFTKKTYNLTLEWAINQALKGLPVQQFAVAGAETDVCVMQSVLGLLRMGYQVFLLEDCLFTSEPHPGLALRRMAQAGAISTTLKSLAYELVISTERTPWYPEGWADRDRGHAKPFPEAFVPPEEWPAWEPKW